MGTSEPPEPERWEHDPADATILDAPLSDEEPTDHEVALRSPDATASLPPRDAAPVASSGPDPGEQIADLPEGYQVQEVLGVGGMGVVFAARSERLGRPVAVKVVKTDREEARRRFEREARVAARLQHPSIVPVYGTGRYRDGRPFYTMKRLTGRPLDELIAATRAPAQRLALLPNVIAIADAMAYAHQQRIIHRDLKPQNVLVGDFGETVVIDWGLAKDLSDQSPEAVSDDPYRGPAAATAHGKVMGTPAYMPLEQARGGAVDARADVYAIGAILYHVLAGRPPYTVPGEMVPWESMLARVLSGVPVAVDAIDPGLAPDLVAIVKKAMAPYPEGRYATAAELAADLRRFQTGQLVGVHRYSTWQLVRRWLRRHRAPVAVAGLALVVIAIVSIVALERVVDARHVAEDERDTANRTLVASLQDRGRTELLAGHFDRALVYLAEAFRRDSTSPDARITRRLIHAASRPYDAQLQVLDAGGVATGAIFSPDGARLLVTSMSGDAIVFDARTGARLATLHGHTDGIVTAAFSPDGARVATGSFDHTARLWNASSGAAIATVATVGDTVLSVAFRSDGKYLVTASADGEVRVADGVTGQAVSASRHAGAVYHAEWSPDRAHVLTASADRRAAIIDEVNQTMVPLDHPDAVTSAQFSADGTRVLTASNDGGVRLWDAASGAALAARDLLHLEPGALSLSRLQAIFSPDGTEILVRTGTDHTTILSSADLQVLATLDGNGAVWSPDSKLIAASDGDRVVVYEVATRRVRATLTGHRGAIEQLSFSPDGKQLASASRDGTARIWSIAGELLASEAVTGSRPSTSPDGAYVVEPEGDVRIETERFALRRASDHSLLFERGGASYGFAAGGSRLVTGHFHHVGERDQLELSLVSLPDGKELATWGDANTQLADVTPDGKRIVTLRGDDLELRDGESGEPVASYHLPGVIGLQFAFSPDSKLIAFGAVGIKPPVHVVELATGKTILEIPSSAPSIAFDRTGGRLATLGGGGADIWDVRDGSLLAHLEGHTRPVYAASFSADGDLVATGSEDGTARVWNARTGQPLLQITTGNSSVSSVELVDDDTHLKTSSPGENGARVEETWDVGVDTRSPAELDVFVSMRDLWRFDGGLLFPVATPRLEPEPDWVADVVGDGTANWTVWKLSREPTP